MRGVQIEYCVPCGLLGRAEEVQHALLSELGLRIDGLRMKPSHGGAFRVSVDGELIFDKRRDGFDVAEIVRRVEECVGTTGEPIGASQRRR